MVVAGLHRHRSLAPGTGSVLCLLAWASLVGAQPQPDREWPAPAEDKADRSATSESASSQPEIVMPKLVHFEHAPYPEPALEAGLEGEVLLLLTIDRQGNVTEAEVVRPAGHGFDEAARAAALRFKFEPALRDGRPVPSRIEYRYSFTLTPAEPAPKATPPPSRGGLEGVVRMAGTNVPLAGAELVLNGPDGVERRIVTDAEGKWALENLPPGQYRVVVQATGFEASENTEQVVAGEATVVTYRLAAEAQGLEVTVRGERPAREVTRRVLEQREIARIPGTGGDALRSVQSLPGVARAPGLAGILIVRGSAPEDTSTFIDGVEVPLIYHFGGLSSVVPTELLERIDFYPGNFGARYGRLAGGIVDVALRSPDTRCRGPYGQPTDRTGCYHGFAELDLINGRLLLEGPLGPLKNWSFAASARRSWFDTWLKPLLEATGAGVTTAPVYYDYQLLAETKPTRSSRLSLRGYGSDDRIEILIRDPVAQDPGFGGNITFGSAFYQLQALYQERPTREVSLESMVAVGRQALDFSLGTFRFVVISYPVTLRSEAGFRLAPQATMNLGMDLVGGAYEFTARMPSPPRPGEPDPGPYSTRPPLEREDSGVGFRPGWFLESELRPTQRLQLVPSIRLDFARDTGHADASPRLSARYDLVPGDHGSSSAALPARSGRRTTLKGGVGFYYQPPQYQETDLTFGTPGLLSNRSLHTSLGVEQELGPQIEASIEGFYKDLSRLVARASGDALGYTNQGQGRVIGLETLIKYRPDRRFFGWVAYTLSRSTRRDSESAPERLFQFDQTHNLTALGSYRLGRGWEFGARFRLVSGNLETPVVGAPSLPALLAADAGSYRPLEGEPFSRRLPLFHQLDLRVDKRWQFEAWQLLAYLDVQNVYNHASVEGIVYNYNYSQWAYQTGIPILPSLGIRGEF